jgi:hypothetical protein
MRVDSPSAVLTQGEKQPSGPGGVYVLHIFPTVLQLLQADLNLLHIFPTPLQLLQADLNIEGTLISTLPLLFLCSSPHPLPPSLPPSVARMHLCAAVADILLRYQRFDWS